MAGRHRRPPAWRRLLLRLRRTDRAARLAALQAEVVALRATVAELRAELASRAVTEPAQQAGQALRYVTLDLPMVELPADAPATVVATAAAPDEIDLRDLPEAALLDPRQDRADATLEAALEEVAPGAAASAARAAHKVSAGKHARPAPLRRIA